MIRSRRTAPHLPPHLAPIRDALDDIARMLAAQVMRDMAQQQTPREQSRRHKPRLRIVSRRGGS